MIALSTACCERSASPPPLRRALLSASPAVSRADDDGASPLPLPDAARLCLADVGRLRLAGVDRLRLDPEADRLLPEPEAERLLPEPDAERLLPEPDAERLLPDPEAERLLPDPDAERLLPDPEAERLLPPDPEDDRPLADRDCRVPLAALRVLPLRVLPPELRLEPDPDEPPLLLALERVFAALLSSEDDDFADLERLELPRGLVADISTSGVSECAGPRTMGRTGRNRH